MTELPTGTVTFLFTDVEGSSRLWEAYPDAMQGAMARHDEIIRGAIEFHHGYVVKTTGDGFHAAFATASDAVTAAVDAQLGLVMEPWSETEPIRARVGIHTGAAEIRDGDYYGPALNRAARLASAGHGGQVLLSGVSSELIRGSGVDLLDLGSHQLRDLGEPERVFQVLHSELVSEFPALRTLDAFATNLPLQMTTFIARDDDVADIKDALVQNRVVTLIGVGGVGKTRLAIQTAAEALPHYRDGVWLCELGPLSDEGQVPDVVATALNVQQRPGQSITESLMLTLRSKEMLVVLDNCEHVLDAAAQLVGDVVGSCPAVRVLATGREGLGVRGERMMMVRSLPLPARNATTEEILAADAVRLFVERAEQAGADVELDAETVATLAQLCRRLDGIPLAIELAAARARVMSPQEITARLDERFRLLTGGSRTAVERHQTLRRAVEWSYELLDERERAVLDRLGVFAGGFTLDAAEAVVSDDDVETLDVLDSIAQLVDKSLVEPEREQHGTRYRLLETIRTYALERLDDRGATDEIRRRHATWCAAFMAEAGAGLRGPDEPLWLGRIYGEVDNIRAALTWATGADDADVSLSLIGDLGFWHLQSRRLGYLLGPWAAPVLQTTGAADDPRFAHVLAVRALDHLNHQRLDDAERDARQAIDRFAQPGTPFDYSAWAVLCLAHIYAGHAAELDGADAFVGAARATAEDYTIASALTIVAGWSYVLGNRERCLTVAEEAMQIAQRLGNPSLLAYTGFYLGGALETTDPTRARSALETALERAKAVDYEQIAASCLSWLGRMGADVATPQWATQFRRGLDIMYEAGDTRGLLQHLDIYAQSLAVTGRAETAATLAAAVAQLSPHTSNPISIEHRQITNERLRAKLGEERFKELTAHGASLTYDQAVALALGELDHVIANNN
ncbi:MAG TPA: adenylate/guanylate cyclase domain-containing protein [Acidimicrobiia bacterium]|nr:adenylate/guanylate cyclase domain-containing protein [Acidimicrobiia bacterium]